MGGTRKKRDLTPLETASLLRSTLKGFCGCCNKEFDKDLRKSRKFIANPSGVPGQEKTIDVFQGVEDIFVWRHGSQLTGSVDQNLALCPSCGIIVAKLYTAVKLFQDAKAELSYLTKVVDITLAKESKSTDTGEDEAEAQAEQEAMRYAYGDFGDWEGNTGSGVPRSSVHVKDNSDKEFRCDNCPAGFNKQTYLTRHLLLSHGIGDRQKDFRCDVCGKEYYFSYLLKNHERIHGEARPFVCKLPNCTTAFKTQNGLFHHVKNYHRPNRPYKCSFCDKDFKENRSRRAHEAFVHKISRSIRPWTCEFCGTKYRRKTGLTSHIAKQCTKNPERPNVPPLPSNAEFRKNMESQKEIGHVDIHLAYNNTTTKRREMDAENQAAVASISGEQMEVSAIEYVLTHQSQP